MIIHDSPCWSHTRQYVSRVQADPHMCVIPPRRSTQGQNRVPGKSPNTCSEVVHLCMDSLGCRCLPTKYDEKTASKYSSEMGGQFNTKNVSTDKELVRHTYAIPNSECAIPGVSIYHGHTLRHTSQAIPPQGQNRVPGKSPNTCSEVVHLCMDPLGCRCLPHVFNH